LIRFAAKTKPHSLFSKSGEKQNAVISAGTFQIRNGIDAIAPMPFFLNHSDLS